jgi:hypothetical protein
MDFIADGFHELLVDVDGILWLASYGSCVHLVHSIASCMHLYHVCIYIMCAFILYCTVL